MHATPSAANGYARDALTTPRQPGHSDFDSECLLRLVTSRVAKGLSNDLTYTKPLPSLHHYLLRIQNHGRLLIPTEAVRCRQERL